MDRMKKEWKTSLQRGEVIGLHACQAVTNYACVSMAPLRKPDDLAALASANNYALMCMTGEGAALGSGRWEVIAQLGEGGYAEVYVVSDLATADSPRVCSSFGGLLMLMGMLSLTVARVIQDSPH